MVSKDNRLIWMDLEMSGLDFNKEVILEIATIVTDNNLNIIASGPELIVKQPDEILDKMDPWCIDTHTKTGLLEAVKKSTITIQQAEQETLKFLKEFCAPETAHLCGNTVWFDKIFLKNEMPELNAFLPYRVVDVSAFKVLLSRWTKRKNLFKKKNTHRALADIRESIEELKYYKKHYIKLPDL